MWAAMKTIQKYMIQKHTKIFFNKSINKKKYLHNTNSFFFFSFFPFSFKSQTHSKITINIVFALFWHLLTQTYIHSSTLYHDKQYVYLISCIRLCWVFKVWVRPSRAVPEKGKQNPQQLQRFTTRVVSIIINHTMTNIVTMQWRQYFFFPHSSKLQITLADSLLG